MTQVHTVQKARKDYPAQGIKKGDTYYWWAFRFGGKHMSKTYPKPQQLTQSGFLQSVYDLQDQIEGISGSSQDDFESQVSSICDEIRNLASEQEDKLSNMPDQLQSAPVGETLQNRADSLNEWADELENVDISIDVDDFLADAEDEFSDEADPEKKKQLIEEAVQQKTEERIEEIQSELTGCTYNGE